jgi:SAM-dependent methyltransferase
VVSSVAERLRDRFYRDVDHPYRVFERQVERLLVPESVVLDAGCGRTVPVLRKFLGRARRLIGVDLVEFTLSPPGIETYRSDLSSIPIDSGCVDIVISRSVFEHLADPAAVYREFERVLRPGGAIVFLTANMWDYGTLVAKAVPNRFHAAIVRRTEGRNEEDTFPTEYRTNTRSDVARLAAQAGLTIDSFEYLGQYPNYLMFNGPLFFVGMCYEKLTGRFEFLRALRGWILVTLRKPAA